MVLAAWATIGRAGEAETLLRRAAEMPATEALDMVSREDDPQIALPLFAEVLRNSKNPGAPEVVDGMLELAGREGQLDPMGLLVRFNVDSGSISSVVQVLAEREEKTAHQLASAVLLAHHLHAYVTDPARYRSARNDQTGFRLKEVEEKGAFKPTPFPERFIPTVPPGLITSRDATTRLYASTAAALHGDGAYADLMPRLPPSTPGLAAAKLLYLSRGGNPPELADIGKLLTTALKRTAPAAPRPQGGRESFGLCPPPASIACMALAEVGNPGTLPALVTLLTHGDRAVRFDAVRALRAFPESEGVVPAMARVLPKAEGMMLVEICALLADRPDARMTPPLIQRLERERGRFRLDLTYALSCIAGEPKGKNAEEWKTWWIQHREGFEVDAEASAAFRREHRPQQMNIPGLGYFYGLPIYSDRLIYVVDTSGSMKGDRITELRGNLTTSIGSLEKSAAGSRPRVGLHFNLIDFGGDVNVMEEEMTPDFASGYRHLKEMPLTWATRTYDALKAALEFKRADTLYFISDGAPYQGEVESWNRILQALDLLTLYHPVAIYSVAYEPEKSGGDWMTRMAWERFGEYGQPR